MMVKSVPFRMKGRLGVGEWMYPFEHLQRGLVSGDGGKTLLKQDNLKVRLFFEEWASGWWGLDWGVK